MREKIFHMAGVTTPEEQTAQALRHAIREAGREPVQRDSYYNHLGRRRPTAQSEAPACRRRTGLRLRCSQFDSLRLGCVRYLNALPLIDGWPGAVRFDHPSTLCRELAAGQLGCRARLELRIPAQPGLLGGGWRSDLRPDGPVYSVILAHVDAVEDIAGE